MTDQKDKSKEKLPVAKSDSNPDALTLFTSPSYGAVSQLRSPLISNNVFNIPKPNRPRLEHHRGKEQRPRKYYDSEEDVFRDPVEIMNQRLLSQPVPVPIRPPTAPQYKAIHKPMAIKYYSLQTPFSKHAEEDALKKELQSQGMSQIDAALFEDKFGDYANLPPVDPERAAKDVKALLEGAFDDNKAKPRTRRQKKILAESIDDMTEQMRSISVESGHGKKEAEETSFNEEEGEEEEDDHDIDDGSRDGLSVKLLPHQIDGVEWMVRQEIGTESKKTVTKGGILADDMGLGKTIQTISLLLLNPRVRGEKSKLSPGVSKSTLVVAPLALIKQWERELEEKVEDSHYLKVLVHHGPKRTRSGQDLRRYDVVITTYQTITSEHEASDPKDDGRKVGCFDVQWYRIILDEAHTIKNRNAKCTKGCYNLRAEYRWCLTGTPMQNHLDELHSLIAFLRVKSFSQKNVWKQKIVEPMGKGNTDLAIQRLQAILKTIMKRRTKDVLRQQAGFGNDDTNTQGFKLVDRKVELVTTEFTARELRFYRQLQQKADDNIERMMSAEGLNFAGALALLLRLRQACNHQELIKKTLGSDPDALEVVDKSITSKSTSKASQGSSQNINSLADLLGGLEVNEKRCELCGDKLSREETSSKMIRCVDCQYFIEDDVGEEEDEHDVKAGVHKQSRKIPTSSKVVRGERTRQIINDSEDGDDGDDDEEGDWVVPVGQRTVTNLGKAGGVEDEDAEGKGEWLVSDDNDTDEESFTKSVSQRRQAISLTSTDESSITDQDDLLELEKSKKKLGSSTKIQAVLKILRKEAANHKFIIFSEWTSMLNLLEPFMKREKIRYCRYDGKMRNNAREASLEQLREDKKTRVLLCSLKCGSLGLNLTAASRVIIMEPFWNPVSLDIMKLYLLRKSNVS